VGVFARLDNNGSAPLALATARWLEPGQVSELVLPLASIPDGGLTLVVDPFNNLVETDEANNAIDIESPS
jgi:hypothetical protein